MNSGLMIEVCGGGTQPRRSAATGGRGGGTGARVGVAEKEGVLGGAGWGTEHHETLSYGATQREEDEEIGPLRLQVARPSRLLGLVV